MAIAKSTRKGPDTGPVRKEMTVKRTAGGGTSKPPVSHPYKGGRGK